MSKQLEFSTNWNGKLHCTIWHTLRRTARFDVGDRVEISIKGKLLGVAECIMKIRYPNMATIPEEICLLDTGYGQAETQSILQRMYKDEDPALVPIYGYLFKWMQTTGEKNNLKKTVQLSMVL